MNRKEKMVLAQTLFNKMLHFLYIVNLFVGTDICKHH